MIAVAAFTAGFALGAVWVCVLLFLTAKLAMRRALYP